MSVLKPDTCCKYNHVTYIKQICYVNLDIVRFTSVWFQILLTLCVKVKNNLKPVTCGYRLPIHAA